MTNATETTIKTVESFGHTFAVTREVIFKDLRNGWEGQTRIDMGLDGFGQPRMLMLTTGKPHRRQDKGIGATTTATLYKVDGAFISVAMFHDFYDTVHVGKPGKCTEREVRESPGQSLNLHCSRWSTSNLCCWQRQRWTL